LILLPSLPAFLALGYLLPKQEGSPLLLLAANREYARVALLD
jgi:hypothetical protein